MEVSLGLLLKAEPANLEKRVSVLTSSPHPSLHGQTLLIRPLHPKSLRVLQGRRKRPQDNRDRADDRQDSEEVIILMGWLIIIKTDECRTTLRHNNMSWLERECGWDCGVQPFALLRSV